MRRAIDTKSDEGSEDEGEDQRAEVMRVNKSTDTTESSGHNRIPGKRASGDIGGSHATFDEAAKRDHLDGWRNDQFDSSEVAIEFAKRSYGEGLQLKPKISKLKFYMN